MQPDALCLNIRSFLSFFNLEDSYFVPVMYYSIYTFLAGATLAVVLWTVFCIVGTLRPSRLKRGKSGSTFDV